MSNNDSTTTSNWAQQLALPDQPAPQDWQKLASPGHIPLSHMRALAESKPHFAAIWALLGSMFLAVIVSFASFSLTAWLAESGVSAASFIAKIVVDTGSDAPTLKPIEPNIPELSQEQIQALTRVDDANAWIDASLARLKSGQKPEFCDFGKRLISEAWLKGDGSAPLCRESKKDRVWVWGVVKHGSDDYPQAAPMFGIFRKDKNDVWTYLAASDAGVTWPGRHPISIADVPRAAALDFPELLAN